MIDIKMEIAKSIYVFYNYKDNRKFIISDGTYDCQNMRNADVFTTTIFDDIQPLLWDDAMEQLYNLAESISIQNKEQNYDYIIIYHHKKNSEYFDEVYYFIEALESYGCDTDKIIFIHN